MTIAIAIGVGTANCIHIRRHILATNVKCVQYIGHNYEPCGIDAERFSIYLSSQKDSKSIHE